MSTPFAPPPQQQYSPVTPTSALDCVPTCCAMAASRATVGVVHVNHATIRAHASQQTSGMTYQDAVAATKAATGVVGQALFGVPPVNAKTLLIGGNVLTVSIDTHATAGTPYRTNNFLGGHSVYANTYFTTGDLVKVKDPGTSAGYLNWPWSLLVDAALLRSGQRGMNLIVWPDTEGVTWTGKNLRSVHPLPSYAKVAGNAPIGQVHPGLAYVTGRTTNGEPVKQASGYVNDGWVQVKVGGKWGYVEASAFR